MASRKESRAKNPSRGPLIDLYFETRSLEPSFFCVAYLEGEEPKNRSTRPFLDLCPETRRRETSAICIALLGGEQRADHVAFRSFVLVKVQKRRTDYEKHVSDQRGFIYLSARQTV